MRKILQIVYDKRLIFKIHKELIQLNSKRKKSIKVKSIGKRLKEIFPNRYLEGYQVYEKMLNIISLVIRVTAAMKLKDTCFLEEKI